MSVLILPQRWRRQPPGPVSIDWSHPLAQGLSHYILHNAGGGRLVDPAHSNTLLANVPVRPGYSQAGLGSPGGVGLNFTGAGSEYYDVTSSVSPSSGDMTVLCLASIVSGSGDVALLSADDGVTRRWAFSLYSDYTLHFARWDGSGPVASATSAVATALRETAFVGVSKGGNTTSYINGIPGSAASGGTMVSWAGDIRIGALLSNGGGPLAGVMPAWAIWSRALSDAEVAALTDAPYQFLRTRKRRLWVFVGGTSVSTNVTGVSATGAAGSATVSGSANVSATGVSATGTAGTATVAIGISAAPTGVSATGAVGSATVSAGAAASATGVQAAGSAGTATVTAGSAVAATGVQASAAAGTATVSGAANVSATGVQADGSAGTATATVGITASATGVAATGAAGTATVTGSAVVSATGVSATGAAGTVTVTTAGDATATVTGVSATGSAGTATVTGNASTSVTGVSATGAAGTATAGVSVTATVTGVQATSAAGTAKARPYNKHRFWRIYVDAIVSGFVSIGELELRATPGGADQTSGLTATASSEYDGTQTAAKAIDDNNATEWASNGTPPQWLKVDAGAGNAIAVAEWVIRARANASLVGNTPINMHLDYSDDNIDWTVYDTRNGETGWSASEARTYTINPPVTPAARYWEWRFTAGVSTYTTVSEAELRAVSGGQDQTTYGTKSADSLYTGAYPASQAFDNDNATQWASATGYPHWLRYDAGANLRVSVGEYTVRAKTADVADAPTAWTLRRSDNATDWTAVDPRSGQSFSPAQTITYTIPETVATVTGVSATVAAGSVTVTSGGNVSTNATGVAATGSAGTATVSAGASVSVTGVSATGAAGTAAASSSTSVAVTGVSATGSAGTAVATGGATVSPTGQGATGSAGTATVTGGASCSIAGVQATGSVGAVTAGSVTTANATGVAATAAAGTVTVTGSASTSPAGQSATAQAGAATVTGSAVVPVTGVQATAAAGTAAVTITVNATATVTGVAATSAAGTVTASGGAVVTVTGVQALAVIGPVVGPTSVSVAVAGVVARGLVGLLFTPPPRRDFTITPPPRRYTVRAAARRYAHTAPLRRKR